MQDDNLLITGQLNITFHCICTLGECQLKCGQGVFWRMRTGPTVGDHCWFWKIS
jgi:hypothetical protein